MKGQANFLRVVRLLSAAAVVIALVMLAGQKLAPKALGKGAAAVGQTSVQQEPWTEAQTVKPAELAKELADTRNTNRPVVVCSGVRVLYEGAHVPGAVYHGAAGKPQGLADLKKWAQGIPRSSNVVVYCGCCPFDRCPNIRPAFEALHAMGFEHLRVLVLPNDFAQDWVEARYPYDKGKG